MGLIRDPHDLGCVETSFCRKAMAIQLHSVLVTNLNYPRNSLSLADEGKAFTFSHWDATIGDAFCEKVKQVQHQDLDDLASGTEP
jgi:hypothetical protein